MKNLIATVFILTFANMAHAELSLGIQNRTAIVLPFSTSSCQATLEAQSRGTEPAIDLPGNLVILRTPKLKFLSTQTETMRIQSIVLTASSERFEGGDYRCEISGAELAALFSSTADQPWNAQMLPGTILEVNPACETIRCGRLRLTQPGAFRAMGKIIVNGETRNDITGALAPVHAISSVMLQNQL